MRRVEALAAVVLLAALPLGGTPAAAQPAREHMGLVASLGGEFAGPQADYVQRVGDRMAQAAGMRQRCIFTVLNSEVVNAFTAPPGCYVYITRGLLSIMNSEAELAAVLGHELGHVTAKHAQRQEQAEALSGLAAALIGAATKSDIAGGIAGRVGKLGTLSYSRNQEYEADTLALRYLPMAGYAPEGLTRVLDGLQREDAFNTQTTGQGGAATPAWARTHPLTGDRIQRAETQAARIAYAEDLALDQRAFLAALDGMPFGDDPGQGVVRGGSFVHPALRIRFDAPQGFALSNTPQAVRVAGPQGMLAEFAPGQAPASQLEAYAAAVMRGIIRQGRHELGQAQRTTINGMPAVVLPARALSAGRPVDLTVVAYAAGGNQVYHFVSMAPAGQAGVFDGMYESFRRLSDRDAEAVGGRRIAVVTVRPGDTAETMSARMPPERDRLARFLMLNNLRPGEPLAPGAQVKIVTEGRR
ncbi:M48 family metalloprotease [Phenylobacterium sp. SCN 70-31]|uniref:M48 family metalloprotease n=1 Tax=Phenylobacterium sp. SCN 70-31 TaxID=1660129 RepID=UPI00086C6E70|nr:M48 family metalloprotease [Phenylobacterium sp. SCN 70-31]ODT86660.1 MAG: hypothetical protein ABS78_15350 [Phenylobacterium sp. SCN 70-31]